MGERNQGPATAEVIDDIFEPGLGELTEQDLNELTSVSSARHSLAEKRHRAEQRLEERRLRDELGDYDLELDDF